MALTDDFKSALATWATGVSVVTTNDGGLLYGITVSSFTSVSLDPPLVLVCIGHGNRMPEMLARSKRFAVCVLAEDQLDASAYFATPGREPTQGFVEIEGEFTKLGLPIVKGSLAHVVCELDAVHEGGDHAILVGRVVHAASVEGRPLLYWRRGYHAMEPTD